MRLSQRHDAQVDSLKAEIERLKDEVKETKRTKVSLHVNTIWFLVLPFV